MKRKAEAILPRLAAPVAYTVVLWGASRLGLPSARTVIGLLPLVLLFSYKTGSLRFSVAKHPGFRDILLLLLLLAASIFFSSLFPANREADGILYTAAVLAAAPMNEELLFRAFVLEKAHDRFERIVLLCVSAAVFAASHARPIPAFVIGLLLGLIYLRYESLTIPLIFHILLNGSILLLKY